MSESSLLLKWGTLKGWSFPNGDEKALALLQEYHDHGASISAMAQSDTPRQVEIICELIDLADIITNDWSGEDLTKDAAKEYVRGYRKKPQAQPGQNDCT